ARVDALVPEGGGRRDRPAVRGQLRRLGVHGDGKAAVGGAGIAADEGRRVAGNERRRGGRVARRLLLSLCSARRGDDDALPALHQGRPGGRPRRRGPRPAVHLLMGHYGGLEILWFSLILVLWIGYFCLEGFDFGVGMLLRVVGRDRTERRVLMHTVGPVWDGNEVWLIVGAGATFAAFPEWYSTLFSGFYLPLLLIVLALVLRPVGLEFWGKDDNPAWRSAWEWALVVGSVLPAFLWGVAFANIVHGVPMNADHEVTGSLFDLLSPYALLGGLTTLLLCASQGATFLTLKTRDETLARARRVAGVLAPVSAVSVLAFVPWTLVHSSDLGQLGAAPLVLGVAAAAFAVVVPVLGRLRAGWAFAANGATIALVFAMLFVDLYPNVLVSSTDAAY